MHSVVRKTKINKKCTNSELNLTCNVVDFNIATKLKPGCHTRPQCLHSSAPSKAPAIQRQEAITTPKAISTNTLARKP